MAETSALKTWEKTAIRFKIQLAESNLSRLQAKIKIFHLDTHYYQCR